MVCLLCLSEKSAAAHGMPQDEGSDSPYADWPVVASLDQVGNNADLMAEFTLDECTAMRLYAVGEGMQAGMSDYGTIERVDTGQVVWQMYPFETEPGARPINRRVDRPISLPAGDYRLRFHTNGSHAYDDWGGRAPEHRFWGIALYEDLSADQTAATCWDYADRPEDLGWSSRRLNGLIPELERMNVAALMVVTDGQVVFDWGNTANNFQAHSMRKSLLSALYGIAVEEGTIDLSQTLEALGIDDKKPLTGTEKQATVADLLKARSGVYIPALGEAASMIANRPARGSHAPGTFWYYNNWDFNALGTIYDQETGEKNIYEAFQRQIAGPIGMQDLEIDRLYYRHEPQSLHPYYGFRISARDLARFGQLYLEHGMWKGEQVIPAGWVSESVFPYSRTPDAGTYSGYGYMWWISAADHWSIPEGSFAASGYGGHTVEVLPDLNTVIVLRVNTDDPTVKLLNSQMADRLVIKMLRTLDRGRTLRDPYIRGVYAMLVWGALIAVSLILLFTSLARGGVLPRVTVLIWAAIAVLFGPLGLLAYWLTCRLPIYTGHVPSHWQRALGATVCCATGNILGVMLLVAAYIAFIPSGSTGPLVLLAAFTVGWLGFRAPPLAVWSGCGYWKALFRTLLSELVSTMLVAAGAMPVFILLDRHWYPYANRLDSPLFWALSVLGALAGALVVYPLNLWLVHRGFQVWPFQGKAEEELPVPTLRTVWGTLLVGLGALVASIVVAT
jgi:CubicO group peptidase (beta-lactamase class C family)